LIPGRYDAALSFMNEILRDFNILSKNFPNKSSCDKMSYDITMKTIGGTLVYGL